MFLSSSDQFLWMLQFEQREQIESARRIRLARLARLPRRRSMRRSLGRQLIRIGARLAADPAIRQARSA